jgi:hypothetical protein
MKTQRMQHVCVHVKNAFATLEKPICSMHHDIIAASFVILAQQNDTLVPYFENTFATLAIPQKQRPHALTMGTATCCFVASLTTCYIFGCFVVLFPHIIVLFMRIPLFYGVLMPTKF